MPLDLATLNRHLTTIVGDLPVTATISGQTVTGTRGPITDDQRLLLGGLDEKLAFNLYFKADAFTASTPPGIGILVEITGDPTKYKVADRKLSADNGQLVILTLAFARRQ